MNATVARCIFPIADIVEHPESTDLIGKSETQLLFGEEFQIEREEGNWLYGTSLNDGYKGYVRTDCLGEKGSQTTHFVSALTALVYPKPDFKSRPILNLSFLSRLIILEAEDNNGFLWAEGTGWIPSAHVLMLNEFDKQVDHVETAKMFLNSPYRYGGRLAWGIDCSGLVQLAFNRNGVFCPRDSSQQMLSVGEEIEKNGVRRGDLVFFPGHVGIMTCADQVLNASARTMSVRIEALDELAKCYGEISCFRRT